MSDPIFNVLFLCTGNTARSVLAEGILRKEGAGRFNAFSAGSQPKGVVNPFALKVLGAYGYPVEGYRSKSWDEFAAPGAPQMDLVITVCDNAANEVCPIWPGHPAGAHWGYADPAAANGSDEQKQAAFKHTMMQMEQRIRLLLELPLAKLDRMALQQQVRGLADHG